MPTAPPGHREPGSTSSLPFPIRLVVYHLLILVGAALFLLGVVKPDLVVGAIGAALMILGGALQMSIILGSIRLARRAAADHRAIGPVGGTGSSRRCLGCGWSGTSTSIFCARCHRVTIPDIFVAPRG